MHSLYEDTSQSGFRQLQNFSVQPSKHTRKLRIVFALLFSLCLNFITFASPSVANTLFCPAHAETVYERIYCQIKTSKYAAFLPTELEFKNNMPRIQYLILKPYAEKLGIKIDKPIKTTPTRSSQREEKTAESKQVNHSKKAKREVSEDLNELSLGSCQMQPMLISCTGNRRYKRQLNRQVSKINPDHLSENNNLSLSNQASNDTNSKQLESFLTQQYKHYLLKMNEIGLIESALVWDKFTQIFFLTREQGVSFSNRFETMFRALKKDRREGLMVKVQQRIRFNLQNCQPLGATQVVCFEGSDLGLFVRQ